MEPLTTFALLVSLAGIPTTLKPTWNTERSNGTSIAPSTLIPSYVADAVGISATKNLSIDSTVNLIGSESLDVLNILSSYADLVDGWDGVDSVAPQWQDLERAVGFVQGIPSSIPLPRPMLSPSGIVGLFWDTEFAYSDVHFDDDNKMSIFIRNRQTGVEHFYDEVAVENLHPDWYFEVFGTLANSYALAA
jgi:hypothetical protein